jgi:hypothetical protein
LENRLWAPQPQASAISAIGWSVQRSSHCGRSTRAFRMYWCGVRPVEALNARQR